MPGTFTQLLFHIIFSTKHREPVISPEIEPRLYNYIGGVIRGERGSLLEIGGVADHVHLLVRWRPDGSLSDLMRSVKGNSSRWMHEQFPATPFAWQDGYAAFSVSKSAEGDVQRYIAGQREHHRARSFMEELEAFLTAHGVAFERRYLE